MTYTLRFLPEVVDDAIAGYSWYEGKAVGLGDKFLILFSCHADLSRRKRELVSASLSLSFP